MSYIHKRNLIHYLNRSKSIKDGSFTHTSISDPPGSFYIQSEDMETFFDLYQKALESKCNNIYLTEKHRDISPILIDFDFRFNPSKYDLESELTHKYTIDMIRDVVSEYITEIKKYVNLDDEVNVYVMEKTSASYVEKVNMIKDGIHIVISDVVTRNSVQLIVRNNLLKRYTTILKDMECDNKISDIFDEAVISKNNWQMYGSRKPNSEAYTITHHWLCNVESMNMKECDLVDDFKYVKELSIRNKFKENTILERNMVEIDKMDRMLRDNDMKRVKKKRLYDKIIEGKETCFTPTCEEILLVKRMIGVLNPERANNYEDWIKLGWCLRNIDISLLNDWDEFSKLSKKYEIGKCDELWYYMKEGGLGVGTLRMWAKEDNPEMYKKLISDDLSHLIYKSCNETDYDIACVITRMFRHKYRCASHKYHIWYEYKDHRWKEIEKGYTLFYKEIPTLLFDEYHKIVSIENAKVLNSGDDEVSKNNAGKNCEILTKIARKLKNTNFVKDKMYKECSGMFYEPNFEDKLDSNPTMIGFMNGVYDLETSEFREGRPEDYISLNTGINYIEYDADNPYINQITDFMEKVLPNKNVRDYVLMLFSSMLDGTNRDEKFHIWTGSGSNGKSKIVELFQNTIGEYACIFNVSLLTQKRVGSSATNSELAISKGKRFAILQEPEENERMNVGIMKELTGGDTVQCRPLFKGPMQFKPMFKMILTCNHMPSIPPDDGGTWRRVRRVEYTSKFVDRPSADNEFKIDRELSSKFNLWRETFMTMLLEIYKTYKQIGCVEDPKEVMDYTMEYQRKNDVFADFCESYIKIEVGGIVSVNTLFQLFKEYCNIDNIKNKMIKKATFQEALEKRYGQVVQMGGAKGKCWKGIEIITQIKINDDDEDP